jgi:hypothetical protein
LATVTTIGLAFWAVKNGASQSNWQERETTAIGTELGP